MSPPHDIVRAVRAELATPGRYHLQTNAVRERNWLAIAVRWLYDRYSDFAQALSHRLHVGSSAVNIFGDVLVVAVVLLVGIVTARLLMFIQMERTARVQSQPLEPSKSASMFARKASEAAAAGQYDLAGRLLFTAAVTLLDLRGAVHDEASATINELRRALRGNAVEEDFMVVARAYTSIAYADHPADETVWRRAHEAYLQMSRRVSA